MQFLTNETNYALIRDEAEALKLGFALGVDALMKRLVAVKQPAPEPQKSIDPKAETPDN